MPRPARRGNRASSARIASDRTRVRQRSEAFGGEAAQERRGPVLAPVGAEQHAVRDVGRERGPQVARLVAEEHRTAQVDVEVARRVEE